MEVFTGNEQSSYGAKRQQKTVQRNYLLTAMRICTTTQKNASYIVFSITIANQSDAEVCIIPCAKQILI